MNHLNYLVQQKDSKDLCNYFINSYKLLLFKIILLTMDHEIKDYDKVQKLELISKSAQLNITALSSRELIHDPEIIISKENMIDTLLCSICYNIFIGFITVMCQYLFCKRCKKRLDFNIYANCRFVSFAPPQKNIILNDIIKKIFPVKYNEWKILFFKEYKSK